MSGFWEHAWVFFDEQTWGLCASLEDTAETSTSSPLDLSAYYRSTALARPRGISYLPGERRLALHCCGPVCIPLAEVDAAVNVAWERKFGPSAQPGR